MASLMNFRVDDDLKDRFTQAAETRQQTQSEAMREALLLYVKRVRNEQLRDAAERIRLPAGTAVPGPLRLYAYQRGIADAADLMTPVDIEAEYNLPGGHWHHGELQVDQLLLNRPTFGVSGYDTPLEGLYLASAGSHPGGGISGLPGRNAAREILKDRFAEGEFVMPVA